MDFQAFQRYMFTEYRCDIDDDTALEALIENGGNFEQAAEWLLSDEPINEPLTARDLFPRWQIERVTR